MLKMYSLTAAVLCLLWAALQAQQTKEITRTEILEAINQTSECESLDKIYIDHLEYFDFFGDGKKEAVVVASTCMTGTAGPDIHSVFGRAANGKVAEVAFRQVEGDPFFNRKSWKVPLFGNRNYSLTVENGKLVARWLDTSDRSAPLVVWYRWDGEAFVAENMKVEGPFPTSYDCSKAAKEMDRAICYSPRVAALDVQLGQAYQTHIRELRPDQKRSFQEQQKEWLNQRDNCVIYKWWVDCLTDLYKKRIRELKQP